MLKTSRPDCCDLAALEKEIPEYKDEYSADYQAKHQELVSIHTSKKNSKASHCGSASFCSFISGMLSAFFP